MLVTSICLFFLWGLVLIFYNPRDYVTTFTEQKAWQAEDYTVDLMALDTNFPGQNYTVSVLHNTIQNGDFAGLIKSDVHTERCHLQQRHRALQNAICVRNLVMGGTFGDPSFKYVTLDLRVHKSMPAHTLTVALVLKLGHSMYLETLESLLYTFYVPQDKQVTSQKELYLKKYKDVEGTWHGIFGTYFQDVMLKLNVFRMKEYVRYLKEYSRESKAEPNTEGMVMVGQFFIRMAETEVEEFYQLPNFLGLMEASGGLWISIQFATALLLLCIFACHWRIVRTLQD